MWCIMMAIGVLGDYLVKKDSYFHYIFMSSLCGVGVRVRVNNIFSKTTKPRDMLFFLKDTLSIEDEKCSRHANLSVRLFARDITRGVPPPKV